MIRLAAPDDAGRIGELLQASFESRLHPFLVYTQRGADRFVKAQLTHPHLYPGRRHVVVEDGGVVIAYADLREHIAATGFLSYICVDADHRGRGVARDVLNAWLSENPHIRRVELDVFEHNEPAVRLYEGLGFLLDSRRTWVRRDMPRPAGHIAVEAIHTTLASIEAYGFGELHLVDERVDRIGLMGERTVRCPDLESFADEDLLTRVAHAMPERRQAFVALEESDYALLTDSDLDYEVLLRSARMSVDAGILQSRLERGGRS